MDEFNSEEELRPDSSDRRPSRQRKGPSVPKIAMSRQHMMIGVGILVLLLVVIGVGSALKSPSQSDSGRQNPVEKNIDLSGSSSLPAAGSSAPGQTAGQEQATPGVANGTVNGGAVANGTANGVNGANQQPQVLNAPQVAAEPTVAPPVNGNSPQHRIDLPGNIADALSQQGDRVNGMTEQMNNEGASSTLPTAPATVAPSAKAPTRRNSETKAPVESRRPTTHRAEPVAAPPARTSSAEAHAVAPRAGAYAEQHAPRSATGSIQSAPSNFYTLQLSSASQSATLNAYARKQHLDPYWVYETRRSGKPWFVLVSGIYSSPAQARSAVAQLPADVRANKPWAREIGQVKQDQNK
ncbi:SPOR domain-containing protein [Martelella alba]|uniref:SPOR domain-containing protein n=1 Tax=Martelella alba TaxID=2590451 RepID=A0ABY2SK10_9HYPH|nr:SPOR domain-containing protein [Martelella alba]TKI05004.1 SPOR domain-containing protein [Martelella alba]